MGAAGDAHPIFGMSASHLVLLLACHCSVRMVNIRVIILVRSGLHSKFSQITHSDKLVLLRL